VGFLKRRVARLSESDEERLAQETQAWAAKAVPDSVRVAAAQPRTKVRLAGVVRRITVRPVHGFDALQVRLWDGTGDVSVQWLGRRTIPGLTLGSRLVVEGMLGVENGDRKVVNPVYEFLPPPEA
jgi:cytochrome c-type biogenesis protein CcmE